jgi:hypothetical protein
MKTTLVFLAFFVMILAVGYGLIDNSNRDLPLADSDRHNASDLQSVKLLHESHTSSQSRYDRVLNGYKPLTATEKHAIRTTPEMPRTDCKSVEVVHYDAAMYAHRRHIHAFENASGFGYYRMGSMTNERGIETGAKEIDRAELVSLLKDEHPAAYVLDEMATPQRARVAHRRNLDEFEERGLQAVRQGADLVWTPEAPKRMFGAIRAENGCITCHARAREGDLLGAFTYFLTKPVDEME